MSSSRSKMSASDVDSSEVSNSPKSYTDMDSPYSSPSQQVPQLTNILTELSCIEGNYVPAITGTTRPMLRIIEHAQNHFRFRYRSEMVGTHGCLLGKSYSNNKTKTYPTVELINYNGKALIRCRLAQENSNREHPHKLLDEDQDRDISKEVPEDGSYKVAFPGLGIIHTAKKDVPALLFAKYAASLQNYNERDLRTRCENEARVINLNIVRLMFTAQDATGAEICPPVFSEPIHNMKSAATNDLKICRMSRTHGRPRGGDDVFIFVEKVNKKNIEIRFFELSEDGREVWTEKAKFLQSDVHHQYGIVFKTPQYVNPQTPTDVKVYVELVRPTNGWTSDPKEFTYKAEQVFKQSKKRKNMSYSSLESSSDGSVRSIGLPAPVVPYNNYNAEEDMNEITMYNVDTNRIFINPEPTTSNINLADALYTVASDLKPEPAATSPMLSQPLVPTMPPISLNSAEFERLLKTNSGLTQEERQRFSDIDFGEYFRESFTGFSADQELLAEAGAANGCPPEAAHNLDKFREPRTFSAEMRANLYSDSGKGKQEPIVTKKTKLNENKPDTKEYNAFYKNEDGLEVKQLVKDICEMMRKKGCKKQDVRNKLDRLFEIRLSNGDTFLHMTLCNNQSGLDAIVKIIHSMKMTHLLNLTNNLRQTILHLAIINDAPNLVPFLISKGCDPMLLDSDNNNLVHFAVICQTCLGPLLESIKTHNVPCDLNAFNNEKQTPLHLAVMYNSPASVELLLQHGASAGARDGEGCTPLHLAVYNDHPSVVRVLLDFIPESDIDVVDGKGYTALQIVCEGSGSSHAVDTLKLLLNKKANPLKLEENNQSAWRLVQDRPDMKAIMQEYVPLDAVDDDDIKSEPEDDYESADEGDDPDVGLQDLPQYVGELSEALDATGAWEELAIRLQHDSLLNWYRNTPSPTRTLLTQIKECGDNVTSKSLVMILEDIGQRDAANIVRKYVN